MHDLPTFPCRRRAWSRLLPAACFALLLLLGISIHRDYGLSFDEEAQLRYGQTVVQYVLGRSQALLSDPDRYHGPAFAMLLVAVQELAGAKDPRTVYGLRHLTTFAVFFVGVVFFYRLCALRFRDWRVGLLGALLLVVSPRIFGQAFYNCKDLVFLSLFVVSVYSLARFLEGTRLRWAVGHAAACALLVDVRVVGALVPAMTAAWTLRDAWVNRGRPAARKALLALAVYAVLVALLAIALWPTLWADPLGQSLQALKHMSRYPWPGQVIYGGALIPGSALPWHYTLRWILISTPVAYTVAFLLGLAAVARQARDRSPEAAEGRRLDAIALAWLLLPLLAIIALHSVVYGAWRHSYFVYPAFLLIALRGITDLFARLRRLRAPWRRRCAVGAAAAALGASLAGTAAFMIRAHPHEDVYFNFLVGGLPGAKLRYDADYWGLSYREGLEFVVARDRSPRIPVYAETYPGVLNAALLRPQDRARLVYVDRPERARYFLGGYRWATQEYAYPDRIFTVEVERTPILAVFRLSGGAASARR